MMLGNNRANGRVLLGNGVGTGFGFQVRCLEHRVWLMVAVPGIHRADDCELIEHARKLRQVLAYLYAGQPGGNHAKGAPVFNRPVWLGVKRINMTGAAGHPEQDHRLVAGD